MLNTEDNSHKYTINCIKDCDFVFLARPCDPGNGNTRVVMVEISQEEEQLLDSGKSLLLTRGRLSFNVHPELCLAYGKLNLNPNSDELTAMDKANWFSRLYVRQFLPSEYDFEHHCMYSDRRLGRWYDTDSIKSYLPYLYNCINHPERVVIFKEYLTAELLFRIESKRRTDLKYYKAHKDEIKKRVNDRRASKKASKLSMLKFNVK